MLLDIFNAKYEFTLVHIGDAGRKSDSGIYRYSLLGRSIDENLLNFPGETNLPGYNQTAYFHIGLLQMRVLPLNRTCCDSILEKMNTIVPNIFLTTDFLEKGV